MKLSIEGVEIEAKLVDELKENILKKAIRKTLIYRPEVELYTTVDPEADKILKVNDGRYFNELKIALIREKTAPSFSDELIIDYEKRERKVVRKEIETSPEYLGHHEIYHAELDQYFNPCLEKYREFYPFFDEVLIDSASIDQGFQEGIEIETGCFMCGPWPTIEFQGPQVIEDPRKHSDVKSKVESMLSFYQKEDYLSEPTNVFWFQRFLSFELGPLSATIFALSYTDNLDPMKAVINIEKFSFLKEDKKHKNWRKEVEKCSSIFKSISYS